jgi:hypothetical protein
MRGAGKSRCLNTRRTVMALGSFSSFSAKAPSTQPMIRLQAGKCLPFVHCCHQSRQKIPPARGCGDRPKVMYGPSPALIRTTSVTPKRSGHINLNNGTCADSDEIGIAAKHKIREGARPRARTHKTGSLNVVCTGPLLSNSDCTAKVPNVR